MKRYEDYEDKEIPWTEYKIVVPTLEDKLELEEAFEHLHYSDVDTENIAVNQLIHEYLTPEITGNPLNINNIIVNKELYEQLGG
jgi:hypothetical protein